MYLDLAEDLISYWAEHPPVHILVAGAVGFKAPRRSGATSTADLARQFGGKVVKRG